MAKKKKPQPTPKTLSPNKYIRLKGRALPIAACYVNDDWQQKGIACIVVARQHLSGNYTTGQYLVDTFCLGMKDAGTHFNIIPEELEELIDQLPHCTEITYNEAHNLIYGAIAYAQEEADIEPHPDFELAQYLLEEDTDDIPLIEYEYGKDGKPFLVAQTYLEASKYLPKLQKRYGESLSYLILGDDYDDHEDYENYDDYEDYDDYEEMDNEFDNDNQEKKMTKDPSITSLQAQTVENLLQVIKRMNQDMKEVAALPHTEYTYVHPEYPNTLTLRHTEVEALYNPKHFYALPRKVIKQLLALPRETLIEDLNKVILYELGKICDITAEEAYDIASTPLTHSLFLLGEFKATESLQIVLEICRQSHHSLDIHFGDSRIETLSPTLYQIARNQTDQLLMFMKEPGLDCVARYCVAHAVTYIGIHEPERKEEVTDWFRQLLRFLITNLADTTVYDATLVGLITSNLLDLHTPELLPELKELYYSGKVDFIYCGQYPAVEESMLEAQAPLDNYTLLNIYQRYKDHEQTWKR